MSTLTANKTIQTVNPVTGENLDEYQLMSTDEMNTAIDNCHQAFLNWKSVSKKERAEHIQKIGEALKNHQQELVTLMTKEMGKLESQGKQEVELCIGICDYTAKNGPDQLADEERDLPEGGKGVITYSPIGVVFGIQPWNFPAYQVIRYAVASLMAGNGVLLKHASSVTGSAKLLEKIFSEAGLPDHLFKVLIIDHNQSEEVIQHDKVRGVTLTGSPSAGKEVAKLAGEQLKKSVMELGSNDAYLVLEDADLEKAVNHCVKGRIYNNGETCVAAKRFVIVDAVYDEFKQQYVKAMESLKMGDPTDDETDLGPMARKDLREDLHEQVEESVEKGAKILCGGEIPDREGFFYPATVLDNVQPGQPAYDDELFGPVASLIRAKDDDDAMRIANDSRFGLGGGIITKDEDKAFDMAINLFDTGMVFINSFGLAQPNMPFGGVKNSGYGREHGGFGIKEFVNAKAIMKLNA